MNKRGFASDNNSGVHPNILGAISSVNQGHVVGYGDDPYTAEAMKAMKRHFGENADIYFVFNGTAANVLSIKALSRSWNSIIASHTSHIHEDECGAPEKFTGSKLHALHTPNGKLTPEIIKQELYGFGFEHHSQPKIISITQVTEMGTVYTPGEIRAISALAKEHGMYLHMDGARIANAAASLGIGFKEFTADAGVDVLSFGGTKNGMMMGESVVFFNKELSGEFKYIRKQGMQLASKMRYIAAQFTEYLKDDLWLKNAMHSNRMAKLLEEKLRDIPGVEITQEVQANGVFAIIPPAIIPKLREQYFFYTWDESRNEQRWMCSFDTREEDVKGFSALLIKLLA